MNPGEYIGKDGRTYRWKHERLSDNSSEGYDHQAHVHEWETEWIDPADWPAAKAALDDLIEAESVEWVEWTWAGGMCRASADGSRVQMWDYCLEKWVDATESRTGAAYRKGREVAEAEQADMRDAVWELVNMALTPLHRQDTWWSGTLADIAKKVGAKL